MQLIWERDLTSIHLQISSRPLSTSNRFRASKRRHFHVIMSVLHISVSTEMADQGDFHLGR